MRTHKLLRCAVRLCLAVLLAMALLCACAAPAAPAPEVPPPTAAPTPSPTPMPSPTEDPQALCALPNLQYETEAYALESLRARGAFAVVEYVETAAIPAGLVTSQSVAPGLCANSGEAVTLLVARKPLPTPSPTPTPTEKPKERREEREEEAPSLPSGESARTPDPAFPTVTPQPTHDPELMEFMQTEWSVPSSSCGG